MARARKPYFCISSRRGKAPRKRGFKRRWNMKILWVSAVPPLPVEKAHLSRLYGPNVEVVVDLHSYNAGTIVQNYRKNNCNALVVNGTTIAVLAHLCSEGLTPMSSELEQISVTDVRVVADITTHDGRRFRFVRFVCVVGITLQNV
jgi:hypothetical protein